MRVILTRLTALAFGFFLLFGQRLTIDATTGGRGAVSVPEVLFLSISTVLWLTLKSRTDGPRAKGLALSTVGPLFTLLLVLPFIGVLIGDYELRALSSSAVVLVPVSILVLGTAGARWGVDTRGVVFVAVVGHGLYGFGQLLSRAGVMPSWLWSWAVSWDAQSQSAYNEAYLISSRSTGLFLNPNEFGLWSVLAVIFGALYLERSRQVITILLGALGVFASQSRTAWLTFVLLVLAYMVSLLRRPRIASASFMTITLASVAVLFVAFSGVFSRLVEAGAVSRFNTGLSVITGGGLSGDANLSSRYVGWYRALEFIQSYTFGTLGPPQLKFGGSIDNQFVSYYLQGGVLLIAAYIWMLMSSFVVLPHRVAQSWKLMIVTVVFVTFSLTASPMDSTISSSLAWVCVILTVQASFRSKCLPNRESPRWPGTDAPPTNREQHRRGHRDATHFLRPDRPRRLGEETRRGLA